MGMDERTHIFYKVFVLEMKQAIRIWARFSLVFTGTSCISIVSPNTKKTPTVPKNGER
jgi:hypothetical protein